MLYVSVTIASGSPEFQVANTDTYRQEGAAFPATVKGAMNLGRFIVNNWGDNVSVSSSSDIDFLREEFNVNMTGTQFEIFMAAGAELASRQNEMDRYMERSESGRWA
jgi:hypothetical protein